MAPSTFHPTILSFRRPVLSLDHHRGVRGTKTQAEERELIAKECAAVRPSPHAYAFLLDF